MRHDDELTDEELDGFLDELGRLDKSRPAGETGTRPPASAKGERPRDDPPSASGEPKEPRFRRERRTPPKPNRRRAALAAATAAVVLVAVGLFSAVAATRVSVPEPEEPPPPASPVRTVTFRKQSYLDGVLELDRMRREHEARRFPRYRLKAPAPPRGGGQPRAAEQTRLSVFVDRVFQALTGLFN
jgi:hypothetical protein